MPLTIPVKSMDPRIKSQIDIKLEIYRWNCPRRKASCVTKRSLLIFHFHMAQKVRRFHFESIHHLFYTLEFTRSSLRFRRCGCCWRRSLRPRRSRAGQGHRLKSGRWATDRREAVGGVAVGSQPRVEARVALAEEGSGVLGCQCQLGVEE